MSEIILLEPDPETRLLIRSLLERDGFRVQEAQDPGHALDVARATRAATRVLAGPAVVAQHPTLAEELHAVRATLEVLTPSSYGGALLEGAAGAEGMSELARDAMLLLAVLAEEGAKRPQLAERLGRMTELTAVKLQLPRAHLEAVSTAAALVALGPSLVAFRFGVQPGGGASGGIAQELQASLAALAAVRCPYDLRPVLESVDERWDGRGRPRGLKGERIPLGARIIAVTRDYCAQLAGGADPITATELVRTRAGSDYDPAVVEAFFQAVRDETYLERLQGGQAGARVLVADGDSGSLSMTEMRLAAAGFEVLTCQDGARAFDVISSERPDVVIAETALPKLDGISLLLKLRRDPQLKNVPLIFTAARTDAGMLNKALKLGAKDVLAKPINFDVLLAKLRALSSGKQEQARAAAAPEARGAASGDLAEMPLADFFRVLSLGRKTAKISVEGPHGRAEVFFDQGTPCAAYTERERGREAFAEVVTWSEGRFYLTIGETPPERNLDRGLEAALLQGTWMGPSESGMGEMGPGMMFTPDEDNPYA